MNQAQQHQAAALLADASRDITEALDAAPALLIDYVVERLISAKIAVDTVREYLPEVDNNS